MQPMTAAPSSDVDPPPSARPPQATRSSQLVRSASIIGAATMTSRLLGLVRDQVLAYLFGAGNAMDAFTIGFRIPNLMRDLFAEGAMSAAFVPTFTRRLAARGRDEAWKLGNQLINVLIVTTGLLVVAGIVLAAPLVSLFAGDYAEVPGKLELTTTLTRIMLPFLSLVAIAAAFMGMLNSLQHFFTPALSPAMFNLAMIASGFALVPLMPRLGLPPITGMAIGAIAGGFGQVIMQWPALHRAGYRYRPMLNLRDPGLREILRLMGPGTLGLAAVQINLLVNTVLATGEGTGAVSWLSYAFRLMYLPIGLFGVSIATAVLPALSQQAARGAPDAMRQTISSALRLTLMLNVPATIGLVALATPIVALIFERGSFTAADTAATAAALACYAPGLLGYSAVKIVVPSFYALGDSRTPALISVGSVALNVALNLLLVRFLGYRGLALGTAIAAVVNAVTLLHVLRRRLGGLEDRRLVTALAKITVAAACMGLAAAAAERWWASVWPTPAVLGQTIRLGSAIAVGLVVLAGTARVLRIEEFDEARRRLLARLRPSRR